MTPALTRGDDGGLHVRRFERPEDAVSADASFTHGMLFPTITPDVARRYLAAARLRRCTRPGGFINLLMEKTKTK